VTSFQGKNKVEKKTSANIFWPQTVPGFLENMYQAVFVLAGEHSVPVVLLHDCGANLTEEECFATKKSEPFGQTP